MAKYRITSKRQDGKILTHIYDSVTEDIVTDKGIPVELWLDPRCAALANKGEPQINDKPERYKKHFYELRIQLGLGCNYHCKYCIATHGEEHSRLEAPIAMPPKQSAKHLVELLKKNDIQCKHIVLWGGEPFVYWKTIVELIPLLKEYLPNASIATITNGSLLSLDKVKFLLDYDIALTISHDGPSFNTYRNDKDPLSDPKIIEAIQYYYDHCKEPEANINFNIVITPENCEILSLPNWFEEKTGRPIRTNFESVVKNDHITDKIITPFEGEYKKKFLNNLVAAAMSDNHMFSSLRQLTSDLMIKLVNKWPTEHMNFHCSSPTANQVAIDMQGNILKCHGTDPKTCTIGHLNNIEQVINDSMIMAEDRENCNDCFFRSICQGSCPMLSQEDLDCYCKNEKIYYSGIWIAAWKILFNATIQKIEQL